MGTEEAVIKIRAVVVVAHVVRLGTGPPAPQNLLLEVSACHGQHHRPHQIDIIAMHILLPSPGEHPHSHGTHRGGHTTAAKLTIWALRTSMTG